MIMRFFALFILSQFVSLSAEPVVSIGEHLIESESLHLVQIDSSLSNEDTATVKQQNTRMLVSYLENYFSERYLEDTDNQVTENEVEQKIDELLVLTYGTSEKPSEEYGKQVKRMAEIVPLFKVYTEDPEMAEKLYSENYSNSLTRREWDQFKEGISATGLEQTMRFLKSELPTDKRIREGYRGQAYAQVLNQKFLDVLGSTDLKYSDWRKERFSQVQILDVNYFEIEQLTAWFGYDESSPEKENFKQVAPGIPSAPPVEETVETVEEITSPEPVIEETVEVTVAEPVEEGVEQSSNWPAWLENWWLCLIGAVVVGGILMIRRKK